MIRIASAHSYDSALNQLKTRQADLAGSQERLVAGKNLNRSSDNPLAAAQAERAFTRLERIKVEQRALASQSETMAQIEGVLAAATQSLQHFRELAVAAGNAALSGTDRSIMAKEMKGLRDQLLGLANSKDIEGKALFSGLGCQGQPFVEVAGTVNFMGISGQVEATETSIPTVLNGHAIFEGVPSANGDLSLFSVLDAIINGMDGAVAGPPGLSQTVQTGLSQIDSGLNHLLAARALTGAWLNRAQAITGIQDLRTLQLTGTRARLEDLDMVEAISQFNNQQTGYEAALKSYAQIQRLSLFNYLS